MPQLVSVRFKYNPKPFWFDPQGKEYSAGADVLVETERGREVGVIHDASIETTDQQISKLKTPLKPVVRKLTDLDYDHLEALEEKGKSAMPFFREKIEEYELDIKPVEVQYVYSGERAIFFFSSEERVDFRDLVRDLAQHFHVRIDMRQIGARDEAKELGGLAHCGEEFCCARFGGEFQPVSIRMAKEQDLPLNPTKISGACGRLMCCLRYEHEAYKDFKKRAPKKGTIVDTPLGNAVISGYNTPKETMELRLEDGKNLNVPLSEIECTKVKDGGTRCHVSYDTIERCATRSMLIALGALDHQLVDLPADVPERDVDFALDSEGGSSRRRRRRGSKKGDGPAERGTPSSGSADRSMPSSGSADRGSAQPGGAGVKKERSQPTGDKAKSSSRRRRRRDTGDTSAGPALQRGDQKKQPKQAQADKKRQRGGSSDKKRQAGGTSEKRPQTGPSAQNTEKPRPGQRSSGLRKRRSHPGNKEG